MTGKSHHFECRIYYEDTDAGGIVYYANYLKFIERARTEWMREIGFESSVSLERGQGFVVAGLKIDYRASAKLDDLIIIKSKVIDRSPLKIVMSQNIYKDEVLLTEVQITLVMVDLNGKPVKIPFELQERLKTYE